MAIALPVLLLIGLGIGDVTRAFYYREAVTNAARQALRVAVSPSQQVTANSVCATSAGTYTESIPPAAASPIATIANDAALESTSTGAPAGSAISGATLRLSWHCAGSPSVVVVNATNGGITDPADPRSDAATATVTFTMPLITPLVGQAIGGRSSFPITITVTGRMLY